MVSHKVGAKLPARAALSSEGLTGEDLLLKLICVVVDQIQFLMGCWT